MITCDVYNLLNFAKRTETSVEEDERSTICSKPRESQKEITTFC